MGRGISAVSGDLGAFLVVAAIVAITPRVDMAVVTRNALMDGRRAALLTALGINLGRSVRSRPAVKRTLDCVTGIVLIGLGARLAFERR
jgi:threonine/homoserine/homoserine lactone efflux protein